MAAERPHLRFRAKSTVLRECTRLPDPNGTVRLDALRERAWRLLMRVSAAQGLEDRVIDAYGRCEAALETVGLAPSVSTGLLVAGLRR